MNNKELVIVIPAYEPNHLMIDLINKLNEFFTCASILIVNDGSVKKQSLEVFEKAKTLPNVTILTHDTNKGKGVALKTAYNYISSLDDTHRIIVTADSDGQHSPEDIYKVANYYKEVNNGVVLGSRQFDKKVPLRSRFGNDATKFLYRLINRKSLKDNQTGLRAFGSELLPFMINTRGNRYEYEMNVLMECARNDIKISEVGIKTIYINNNAESHFRPVRDFLKICKHMLRYCLSTVVSFIVNILSFIGFIFLYAMFYDNSLIVILFSAVSANLVGTIVHLILNASGKCYGNKNLLKIKKLRRAYSYLSLGKMILNCSLIFAMFVLLDSYQNAKVLGDIDFVAIGLLFNYIFAPKAKLH